MSSNVVPIFNEKNPFKKQKRRKNAIADMQSYRGPESTLSWEEAVGLIVTTNMDGRPKNGGGSRRPKGRGRGGKGKSQS